MGKEGKQLWEGAAYELLVGHMRKVFHLATTPIVTVILQFQNKVQKQMLFGRAANAHIVLPLFHVCGLEF